MLNLMKCIYSFIKKNNEWKSMNISLQTVRTAWQDVKIEIPMQFKPREIIIAMDSSAMAVAHHMPLQIYCFRMTNGLSSSDSYMFSYDCFWDYDESKKILIVHVITARMGDNMDPMLFNKLYYR